jgi:hypothetical protein
MPWKATNQPHTLELDLIDGDGQTRLAEPIQGQLEAGRPPGMRAGDEVLIVITFNFDGLKFETPGVHEFVLSLDGTELGRIGFKVLVAGQATLAAREQG